MLLVIWETFNRMFSYNHDSSQLNSPGQLFVATCLGHYNSGCQRSQVHAEVPGVRGPGHRLAGRQLRLVSVRETAAVRPRHPAQASGGAPPHHLPGK